MHSFALNRTVAHQIWEKKLCSRRTRQTGGALCPRFDRQADRENSVARLTEVAKGRGWGIVATFNDAGISGAKERKDGPASTRCSKTPARADLTL